MFTDLRVNFGQKIYFRNEAAYNPYEHNFRYFKAIVTWSNELDMRFMAGYVFEKDVFEGWRTNGRFKVMPSLYTFYRVRYNNESSDKLDGSFGFEYYAQCWGCRLSVDTKGASSGKRSDTSFNYNFFLRGLGNTTKKGFED